MSALARTEMPFEYQNKHDFPAKLVKWIGEVFYDILPKHGYEIREEQIYAAFQLADAVCKQKIHFTEAGLGIGKTFAYLLTTVAYARLKGKPVIIACASTALQEQLAGTHGDIETLSRLLDLGIDSRMAKDPRQYVCDLKVNRLEKPSEEQTGKMFDDLIRWLDRTKNGERSEIPNIPDEIWSQISWDETMPCDSCSSRGFCKLIKARRHYRSAKDLIICDHGVFFDDLWTREELVMDGKSPLLPAYSAVIFDEGHKIILPAAMRAGRQIIEEEIDSMTSFMEQLQGARTSLLTAAVATSDANSEFFKILNQSTSQGEEQTNRLAVGINSELLEAAVILRRSLDTLYWELQNEQGLHSLTLSATRLQIYETRIERTTTALYCFCDTKGGEAIVWVDQTDGSFWVVPRNLGKLLEKHLYSKKLPVVFSSATLSIGGDFSYFVRSIGATEPSSSTVDSPFDFLKQVTVYVLEHFSIMGRDNCSPQALMHLASLLKQSEGRALVLTNSLTEMDKIRTGLKKYQFPFNILWEDEAERGYLVRKFREDVSSVLVGHEFWEGIDVPGQALSQIVIWQLPFPPNDPLIEARRREAKQHGLDPVIEVDYPEMGLKLKQGCGRLIRTKEDQGIITILEPVLDTPWENVVMAALPSGAKILTF